MLIYHYLVFDREGTPVAVFNHNPKIPHAQIVEVCLKDGVVFSMRILP